jgi:hypothetical protein
MAHPEARKKLRSLMKRVNRQADFEQILANLRSTHARRPKFLELLGKAKFK